MPELPEVEVTRQTIEKHVKGSVIQGTRIGLPLRWALSTSHQELEQQTIQQVRRRGKYLIIDLDKGILLIHLGMSGRLIFCDHSTPHSKHDHFDIITDRGIIRLHDPRRFGAIVWSDSETTGMGKKLLAHLGVEPLTDAFNIHDFTEKVKNSTSNIKQLLLSGHIVVGVGNIYACEVLFMAQINPKKAACKVSKAKIANLVNAIKTILAQAIEYGGSTLKDFRSANGEHGLFQVHAKVYGRAGEPCALCHEPIKVIKQSQRSTYFCPKCQK